MKLILSRLLSGMIFESEAFEPRSFPRCVSGSKQGGWGSQNSLISAAREGLKILSGLERRDERSLRMTSRKGPRVCVTRGIERAYTQIRRRRRHFFIYHRAFFAPPPGSARFLSSSRRFTLPPSGFKACYFSARISRGLMSSALRY